MKKPELEKGNYQVIRWCCQSGNCFKCHAGGNLAKRQQVVQTGGVSKAWADYVAHNWSAYGAVAEEMKETA